MWNGRKDADGCPDPGAALILVEDGRIRLAAPATLVGGRRGVLSGATRAALRVAGDALTRIGVGRVTVVTVGEHGQSYGDGVERARRLGALAVPVLVERRAASASSIAVDARGPDGSPRIELRY